MYKAFAALAASFAGTAAHAHSGHHQGAVVETVAHIWSHADHWLPAVAVLTVAIASAACLRSRHVARNNDRQHDE